MAITCRRRANAFAPDAQPYRSAWYSAQPGEALQESYRQRSLRDGAALSEQTPDDVVLDEFLAALDDPGWEQTPLLNPFKQAVDELTMR